ncbi:MAG TPA: RimK/LysX family protein [Candidatus Saccharimonadales bacterium]
MKKTIGAFEKVSFPDFELLNIVAKIDTGATSGSLHATNIKRVKLATGESAVRFRPYGNRPAVIASSFVYKMVRSSNGESSMRYVIPTTVVIQGVQYPIEISLADRTLMKKGVLIGRRFLRSHGFIVDPKRGTKYRGEVTI